MSVPANDNGGSALAPVFDGHAIRVQLDENGERWFYVDDISALLGLPSAFQAWIDALGEHTRIIDDDEGQTLAVSEAGAVAAALPAALVPAISLLMREPSRQNTRLALELIGSQNRNLCRWILWVWPGLSLFCSLLALASENMPPPVHCPTQPSFVYFIRRPDGLIKIGFSKDPQSRRSALAGQSGVMLEMLATKPGDRSEEQALHRRFAAHRVTGEWFRPAPELCEYIADIRRKAAN